MSIQESNLKAIADAIREKDKTSEPIPANKFSERILAISTIPDDMRTITITASPQEGGTVYGGGLAQQGMKVTVSALPDERYEFRGWNTDSGIISTDPEYGLTVTDDITLNAVFNMLETSILPDGYTEVEYISNPEGAYFRNIIQDSDSRPFNNKRLEFVLRLKTLPTEENYGAQSIYGSRYLRSSSSQTESYLYVSSGNFVISGMGGNNGIPASLEISKVIIDSPKNIFAVNEASVEFSGWKTVGSTVPVDLFGHGLYNVNMGLNTNYGNFDFYLYSFKVYASTADETGDLLYNFVPCINSGGMAGLYDIVGNQFYESHISGKSFEAGPAV